MYCKVDIYCTVTAVLYWQVDIYCTLQAGRYLLFCHCYTVLPGRYLLYCNCTVYCYTVLPGIYFLYWYCCIVLQGRYLLYCYCCTLLAGRYLLYCHCYTVMPGRYLLYCHCTAILYCQVDIYFVYYNHFMNSICICFILQLQLLILSSSFLQRIEHGFQYSDLVTLFKCFFGKYMLPELGWFRTLKIWKLLDTFNKCNYLINYRIYKKIFVVGTPCVPPWTHSKKYWVHPQAHRWLIIIESRD